MSYSILLEESIMQKGIYATAGSKMLANFTAPISAAVADSLEAGGMQIAGRAKMSEFGASGLYDDSPCTLLTEAVNAFCSDKNDAILCNDYTGTIAANAARRGLCYIHPTYGTVSRYGLIPAVCSMDQIGVLCKVPSVGFEILAIIAGYDARDGAMLPSANDGGGRTVGFNNNDGGDKRTADTRRTAALPVISVAKMPLYAEIYRQITQILCSAELSGNISRYDGIKFGYAAKDYSDLRELYTKSRTEAFGEDLKLSALIGAMVLGAMCYEKYYDKAMRLRRVIKESVCWDGFDVLRYIHDADGKDAIVFAIFSRLCGLPSLSVQECTYVADAGNEHALSMIAVADEQ
ncbi:MAG: amidase family protein [Oscillospiraceae bacterium]|nr:amidase family protein [Oscillospiraceae bacterium]